MARRGPINTRPAKPGPLCEDCGADVWWAWSIRGRSWVALAPERYPADSTYGTYEVWADQHGGALCEYLAPGERGSRDRSFRGVHHNAACKSWRATTVAALVREARAAVPVMAEGELLVLGHQLQELQKAISSQIRENALRGED